MFRGVASRNREALALARSTEELPAVWIALTALILKMRPAGALSIRQRRST